MKYLGGKHGIGKHIAEYIEKECPPDDVNGYLEPFCGSLGVFKQMTDRGYKEYLKTSKSPNAMKAVAGFGLSFGGKYFAGYAQKWAGNSGRNFLREFKTSIEKIKPTIQKKNVKFYNKSYDDFNPKNMVIYCDPPYKETESYSTGGFDHSKFWDTMRKWSKNNCVFISEEKAPKDFKVVWRRKKRRTLDKTSRFYREEKLYMYKGSKVLKKTRKKTSKKTSKKTLKNKK